MKIIAKSIYGGMFVDKYYLIIKKVWYQRYDILKLCQNIVEQRLNLM